MARNEQTIAYRSRKIKQSSDMNNCTNSAALQFPGSRTGESFLGRNYAFERPFTPIWKPIFTVRLFRF